MKPARIRALERAHRYTWVREVPRGSNRSRKIDEWNRTAGVPAGSPYCDSFHHSMFWAEGVYVGGGAYCPATFDWGKAAGLEVTRPLRGDSVFFDWDGNGELDHVGFVDRVLALRWRGGRFIGLLRTVEANTSSGLAGSQSDGDGVYVRTRWVNSSTRFLRIPG